MVLGLGWRIRFTRLLEIFGVGAPLAWIAGYISGSKTRDNQRKVGPQYWLWLMKATVRLTAKTAWLIAKATWEITKGTAKVLWWSTHSHKEALFQQSYRRLATSQVGYLHSSLFA